MEIELSEDLQHYKESLVLGLTAKQFLFSALALGVGTGIVLLLYEKIGITLSCYVATPFVVPLALTGFYNYHGLTFWQFAGKMIYFSFFNQINYFSCVFQYGVMCKACHYCASAVYSRHRVVFFVSSAFKRFFYNRRKIFVFAYMHKLRI